MVWDRLVTRLRAAVFRRYPSSAMAASTFSRVALLTFGWLLMTRETVWWETPATSATSSRRGILPLLLLAICLLSPLERKARPGPRAAW